MHPVLASCHLLLRIARELIDMVWVRDGLHLRPGQARQSVARRLRQGMRLVEAYLRRMLLILALELEPTLADRPRRPLGRPHGRRCPGPLHRLEVCELRYSPFTGAVAGLLERARDARRDRPRHPPQPVPLGRLYQRMEFLAGIAADPLKRATRLAWHLARSHEGPILAPDHTLRVPGRWGTEVSMTFNLMGHEVLALSKQRPPMREARRWHGPSITWLDW